MPVSIIRAFGIIKGSAAKVNANHKALGKLGFRQRAGQ